jgi:hypothetical protein
MSKKSCQAGVRYRGRKAIRVCNRNARIRVRVKGALASMEMEVCLFHYNRLKASSKHKLEVLEIYPPTSSPWSKEIRLNIYGQPEVVKENHERKAGEASSKDFVDRLRLE